MLLQSHAGEIALLPALPTAWPSGSVTGLKARGAVEVDVAWQDGKATRAALRPGVDGARRLRAPRGQQNRIGDVGRNGDGDDPAGGWERQRSDERRPRVRRDVQMTGGGSANFVISV